ncbi:hypothetical protein BD413DRAFT_254111 [Trametes elegans]|nr:hypothetical protein BD413DRAFT_254111 [Trametes elegans]
MYGSPVGGMPPAVDVYEFLCRICRSSQQAIFTTIDAPSPPEPALLLSAYISDLKLMQRPGSGGFKHEYIIASVSVAPDPQHPILLGVLQCERTVSDDYDAPPEVPVNNDTVSVSPSPSLASSSTAFSSSTATTCTAATEKPVNVTTYDPETTFKDISGNDRVLFHKVYSTGTGPSLMLFAVSAAVLHELSSKYRLSRNQSFWFACMLFRIVVHALPYRRWSGS